MVLSYCWWLVIGLVEGMMVVSFFFLRNLLVGGLMVNDNGVVGVFVVLCCVIDGVLLEKVFIIRYVIVMCMKLLYEYVFVCELWSC